MSEHDICSNCGLGRHEHLGTAFTKCPYPFKGFFREPSTWIAPQQPQADDWQASPKKQKPLNDKLNDLSSKLKDISHAKRVIKDEKGLPIGFEPFNKTAMTQSDAPNERDEPKTEWISVKDKTKVPEEYQLCLVWNTAKQDGWEIEIQGFIPPRFSSKVTHWMPLPKPPKV